MRCHSSLSRHTKGRQFCHRDTGMTDLSDLTNDSLRDHGRAFLLELERRLDIHGLSRQLRRTKLAHAILTDVEDDIYAGGELASSSRSGGEPKD